MSSTVLNFKMEHGICLQTWQQERASTGDDRGTSCFFSSCGGILELQRRTQGASRVPLGKSNLHSSSEGELGIALESLQGNKTSSGVVSRNSGFLSSGDGISGLHSRFNWGVSGSKALRSPLELQRVTLGAH